MSQKESLTGSASEAAARLVDLLSDPSLEAREIEAPAGTALFEPDSPARSLYFIQQGQVRLFLVGPDNSARLLEILGPGEWCGVPALAGAETYGSRAVAVARATVYDIPASRLLDLLPRFPAIASELIHQLAAKLQASQQDAANLVFDDTKDRLIKALLHMSHGAAASPQEGGHGVVLRITHQQLAQAIGAARETVSLTLTQLRQKNLLRTGRNRLSFKPEALEQFYRRGAAVEQPVE